MFKTPNVYRILVISGLALAGCVPFQNLMALGSVRQLGCGGGIWTKITLPLIGLEKSEDQSLNNAWIL